MYKAMTMTMTARPICLRTQVGVSPWVRGCISLGNVRCLAACSHHATNMVRCVSLTLKSVTGAVCCRSSPGSRRLPNTSRVDVARTVITVTMDVTRLSTSVTVCGQSPRSPPCRKRHRQRTSFSSRSMPVHAAAHVLVQLVPLLAVNERHLGDPGHPFHLLDHCSLSLHHHSTSTTRSKY